MIETRFKDTEIGKIPVEWEEGELLEACSLAANNIHSFQIKAIDYIGTENMLSNGMGVLPFEGTLSDNIREYKECDVLISNIRPYLKKIWYAPHNGGCSADVLVFRSNNEDKLNSKYLYYTLSAERFFSYLTGNSIGTKMPRGDKKSLANFIIPIPPLPEQCRIADALSKVDSLIASLDKLIAKKQAIKRGAMQELLTGKKRLPGFQGEWKKDKIESFGEINGGGTPNTNIKAFWTGQFPWISSSDINEDDISNISVSRFITKKAIANSSTILCPSNTIHLVSRVGLGKVAYTQERVCTSQDFCNLTINKENDIIFLSYLLLTKMKSVAKEGQGTTIKGISIEQIKNFVLIVPPLPEQRAIAHVLSSMDAEIAALERKRDKFRQVKQGMMQDLLTGRIRLTDN